MPLDHNYECHAPQKFNAKKILDGICSVNYQVGDGFTIYTLFRILERISGGLDQNIYKRTFENKQSVNDPLDKMFAGYNDEAFLNGLKERLFEMFPEKSRFEI